MRILGPFASPRTSAVTVTAASAAASDVTAASSTSSRTGSLMVPPAGSATRSVEITSPTATRCCLPPLRTIAYMAGRLLDCFGGLGQRFGLRHVAPGIHAAPTRDL